MKIYRPLVMKKSHLFNRHFIDLFYPTVWSKEKKKRIYFGNGKKIVRFRTKEDAAIWLEQFKRKQVKR